MSEKRQILKSAGVVGFYTLLSRMTGLIRDAIMTAVFGNSRLQDIFQVAFELPNTVRRVMGEGALSAFLVPLLSERRKQSGEAAGWEFFNRACNFTTLVALIITMVGMVFSKECFLLFGGLGLKIGSGHVSAADLHAYIEIGTRMTRLMFPFVIALTLASVFMGGCHALRHFTMPSLGSVLLNLTTITAGTLAIKYSWSDNKAVLAMCWAVLIGGYSRLLLMAPVLWKAGWRWRPSLSLRDPEMLRLMQMMGLAVGTMMFSQVNIIVGNQFAMWMGEGIKSALTFSQRLIQFPMALTATAAATGMLPQLTACLLDGRHKELRELMAFTKRLEMLLINPAMLGLIFFGEPILRLIYEHHRWTPQATHETYIALLWYSPCLLPMGWLRLVTPLFYARKDLYTPFKAAFIDLFINIVVNWFFATCTPMRQGGLALANTISTLANYLLLAWYLKRLYPSAVIGEAGERPRIAETFWKSMTAGLIACGIGRLVYSGLVAWRGMAHGTIEQALYLFPVIAGVAALYFLLAHALRVPDSDKAADTILRKLKLRRG
ncbi:murein biosynthesis integral membrane protein MurJ [bacterium]|nr:murein biosynthesis integral membrane protein MurJ [bacterium]